MSKYLNQFLNLKCAGDIIGIVGPMKKYEKEITEAMAIRDVVRKITLKKPMSYTLVDVCSGNGLVPLISVFTMPIKEAIAIDIRERNRPWYLAKRFQYAIGDINNFDYINELLYDKESVILTACHACKHLAINTIDLYHDLNNIKHLVLMPCCQGHVGIILPEIIKEKLGSYLTWSYYLSIKAFGTLKIDEHISSPCNALVTASKEK